MYGRPMRQQSYPYPGSQNGHQNGIQNGYPSGESPISAHSYQHSYETMTSGSEEYGKSTNPSSQNSSFDQLHQLRKPDDFGPENPYANEIKFHNVSPTKPFSPAAHDGHFGQELPSPPQIPTQGYPPPNNPRQPIKLGGSPSESVSHPVDPNSAKKQSWIKRRFSRQNN